MKRNLLIKLKESSFSIIPVTVIVLIICLTMLDVSKYFITTFLIGSVLLIFGIGLFTLGVDMSIMPMGESMGASLTKSKKLWIIITICFLMGILIAIAEPDLVILADQIASIPNLVLIISVSLGVGLFVAIFVLKAFLKLKLSYILIASYLVIFILSFFVKKDFVAIAFDAGGVTTGPICVPFVMALCIGLSAVRGGDSNRDDSFGMVALTLIGPIFTVLILGLFYKTENLQTGGNPEIILNSFKDVFQGFVKPLPSIMKNVAISLLPIIFLFALFQIFTLKLHKMKIIRILVGIIYTYIGLTLFFLGANAGFLPIAKIIGAGLALKSYNWILIIIGVILGFVIVLAEPSVPVLTKQVEEMTGGAISRKTMLMFIASGIAVAVGLSMLRVLYSINILYFLLPCYLTALILSFFVPSIFTGIAFDSGAVASGPLSAVFLLPLAMGAVEILGGNIYTEAIGLVSMVAMAPPVTVQILGLIYNFKMSKIAKERKKAILQLSEEPVEYDLIEFEQKETVNNNPEKNQDKKSRKTKDRQ